MKRCLALLLACVMLLAGCSKADKGWQEYFDLGVRYLSEGDYEEAILAFSAAIVIDPKREDAYILRGDAYLAAAQQLASQSGDEEQIADYLEKAKRDYERAAELAPDRAQEIEEKLNTWNEIARKLYPNETEQTPEETDKTLPLVSDAFVDAIYSAEGETLWCYHIPQINLRNERAKDVNGKIYKQFYDLLEEKVYASIESIGYPSLGGICYFWGQKESVISIVVLSYQMEPYYWDEYIIYNVSAETGKELPSNALLEAYSLTEAEYMEKVKQAIRAYFDSSQLLENGFISEEEYNQLVEDSLADVNMSTAVPFINADGDLCVKVGVYWPAGAGWDPQLLNLTGAGDVRVEGPKCTMDHSVDVAADSTVSSVNTSADDSAENEANQKKLSDVEVGDIIQFGTYEQDNSSANGTESISWIVLDKVQDSILVISKYALDQQPFHTQKASVTWEDSYIRQWLNGTFLSTAFSQSERAMIKTVTVMADKNPVYATDPGDNTTDRIFLLSSEEADNYFDSNLERLCYPTAYVRANRDVWVNPATGGSWWWLRTPGGTTTDAATVNSDGSIDYKDGTVNSMAGTVRPAMWLNLSDTSVYIENTTENTSQNTSPNSSQNTASQNMGNPYQAFLSNKGYASDWSTEHLSSYCTAEYYSVIDINQDGTDELVLLGDMNDGFCVFLIYTIDKATGMVTRLPVDRSDYETNITWCYGTLSYSSKYKALVFSETRYGGLEYYEVSDSDMRLIGSIGCDDSVFGDTATYYSTLNGSYEEISESTWWNTYMSEAKGLEFNTLP